MLLKFNLIRNNIPWNRQLFPYGPVLLPWAVLPSWRAAVMRTHRFTVRNLYFSQLVEILYFTAAMYWNSGRWNIRHVTMTVPPSRRTTSPIQPLYGVLWGKYTYCHKSSYLARLIMYDSSGFACHSSQRTRRNIPLGKFGIYQAKGQKPVYQNWIYRLHLADRYAILRVRKEENNRPQSGLTSQNGK